jgi:hypothetical protein
MAFLVALTVALGLLLVSVPNVELITFAAFASGVLLGRWRGAATGALSMAIYSATNPVGSGLSMPSLYVAQVCAVGVAGLVGGATASIWLPGRGASGISTVRTPKVTVRQARRGAGRVGIHVSAAVTGLALTAVYQAAVILGLAVVSPHFRTGLAAVLISNALFSAIHLASNTIVFAILVPTVLPRMSRLVGRGGGTT